MMGVNSKQCPNRVKDGSTQLWSQPLALGLSFNFLYEETIMEELVADEVESILYVAREISGNPLAIPYKTLMRDRQQYTGSRL